MFHPIYLDLAIVLVVLICAYSDHRAGGMRASARLAGLVVAVWSMPHLLPGLSDLFFFFMHDYDYLISRFFAGFAIIFAIVFAIDLGATYIRAKLKDAAKKQQEKEKRRSKGPMFIGVARGLLVVLVVICASATLRLATYNEIWEESYLAPPMGALLAYLVAYGIYPPSLDNWMSQVHFAKTGKPFIVDESVIVLPPVPGG